jgi:hypothetical protein
MVYQPDFTISRLRSFERGFLFVPLYSLLDGIPDWATSYRRLTPLQALMASREPGGYAVTPPLGGRDFHPHQTSVIKVLHLSLRPPDRAGLEGTCHTQRFGFFGVTSDGRGRLHRFSIGAENNVEAVM